MVAKKKARHLYEILGKGAAQPAAASRQEVSSAESAQVPREGEGAKLPETLIPEEIPSDKALENVIVIRKDTVVVAVLLAVVMWVIAFLLGRWTAQRTASSVSPAPRGTAASVASQVEPPPISAETAQTSPGEKYYLMIISYDEGRKDYADEAAEFLRSRNYPVVVEKSGNKLVINLRDFQSKSDANALRTLSEIRSLEYKGRKDFQSARFVEVK